MQETQTVQGEKRLQSCNLDPIDHGANRAGSLQEKRSGNCYPAENEDTKSKVRNLGIPEVQLQTFEKDKAQVINGFLGIAVLFADKGMR